LDRYPSPSFKREREMRKGREGKGSEFDIESSSQDDRQEIQLAVLETTRSPTYTDRDRGRP
jgi:hypothetical protein